jgi:hypothetical protein
VRTLNLIKRVLFEFGLLLNQLFLGWTVKHYNKKIQFHLAGIMFQVEINLI